MGGVADKVHGDSRSTPISAVHPAAFVAGGLAGSLGISAWSFQSHDRKGVVLDLSEVNKGVGAGL